MAGLFTAAEKDLESYSGMRLPVCLCLDVSSSMEIDNKIDELNRGIKEFYNALRSDEVTKYTAEVAIVTFGGKKEKDKPGKTVYVEKVRDFSRVDIQGDPPVLEAYGYTPIGEGVQKCLEMLEKRKKQYTASGNSYYRPWLVIMSDGRPEGHDPDILEEAKRKIHESAVNKQVVPIAVSIGKIDDIGRKTLKELGDGLTIPMNSKKFLEFFRWLHNSVSSSVGQDVDSIIKELLEGAVVWSCDDFLDFGK